MNAQEKMIYEAAACVKAAIGGREPKIGIVLGSGLGAVADRIEDAVTVPYIDIPGFPRATAIGHKGNFIVGRFGGKEVIAMQGRFHFYEGYDMFTVTLPIRVMQAMKVDTLFVSNAAGGLIDGARIGDLMIIKDPISMIPSPLIGPNHDSFGERFPDMNKPYDRELIAIARRKAAELEIPLLEGVYLALTGPCYETVSEYRFYKMIGAGAVGMSTVPEVTVARHNKMRVFGMSVITDVFVDDENFNGTDAEEVVIAADKASQKMTALFQAVISEL